MKSNKGFTLIELLAVIVILAIIALIATPIILSVIETARRGSAEASALAYIDAVEDQVVIGQVTTDTSDDVAIPTTGNKSYSTAELTNVQVKGAKPSTETGTVVISSTGEVQSGTCLVITINGMTYNVAYNGSTASVQDTACTNPNT